VRAAIVSVHAPELEGWADAPPEVAA
jgi:hypothetical protein